MTEHDTQRLFVAYARKHYPDLLIFAIPNGGLRDIVTAKRLKDEGVLDGVPDLFIASKGKNGEGGLFIEMKTPSGKLTKQQSERINELNERGYRAVVAYGYDKAKQYLTEYLHDEKP
jgi:hypothetical protein